MSLPLLGTILLGGVAALDATPVAQTLLSQPLITAVALGWMWGDMPMAVSVGLVLQLLAAGTLPVGARTPEDYAVGGVVGTGLALALVAGQPFAIAREACAIVGVVGGMLVAVGGVPLLKWQRRRNEGLSRWCEAALRSGRDGALAESHRAAVLLAFAVGLATSAVALGAGLLVLPRVIAGESLRMGRAWTVAEPILLGFGMAQLLNAFVQRRLTRALAFGAGLLLAWMILMLGAP